MNENEEKIDITDVLQFIRLGIQQLGIQISAITSLMVKKGIVTEQEYEEETKKVIEEIGQYIKEMEGNKAVEEEN